MKSKLYKSTLAIALALSLTAPSVTGVVEPISMVEEVEAAARKLSLKTRNRSVYVGSTAKVKVTYTKGAKARFYSTNKKIVTVDSKGNIKGRKAGKAKVKVVIKKKGYKSVTKYLTVTVKRRNQGINAGNLNLYVTNSKNIGAKAKTKIKYKSSNPSVVTVDSKGNLKAKRTGTVKIYMSAGYSTVYNKASKTITVKVVKMNQSVEVSDLNLTVGQSDSVRATAKTRLTFKSSNPLVATVDSRGNVRAVSAGSATIGCYASGNSTYNSAKAYVKVSVKAKEAVKPTETPKPTEVPKPTEIPKPTETPKPTEIPVVEPTDVQKAEIDNICSKQYYNPWMYTNNEMYKASSFKFTTDASLASKGNYCYVESSNTSLIRVSTDGVTLYSSAVQPISENNIGKTVTVTMKMGSYTKTCTVEICETRTDWSKVSEEDIAKSIIDRTDYADEVVRLINEYRVSNGLNALKYEERYCLKSASVASGCAIINACKPDCPNVAATLASHGGSQIGWGTTGGGASNTPQKVVQAWIDSPLHRSNILDKDITTIACAFFINGYRDPRTGNVSEYVSVKCTLSNSELDTLTEVLKNQEDLDNSIIQIIHKYVKNKNDLDKYSNWFFHPKGDVSFPSKDSAQSVGSDDFSVFSDGSELSTDAFTSGESVESAEPVTSESEEVGEPIEIEDSLESSTDSSEDFDDSIESIEIESEE